MTTREPVKIQNKNSNKRSIFRTNLWRIFRTNIHQSSNSGANVWSGYPDLGVSTGDSLMRGSVPIVKGSRVLSYEHDNDGRIGTEFYIDPTARAKLEI